MIIMFSKYILVTACLISVSSCAGSAYVRLQSANGMSQYEGRKVELSGRVSETPWQHLMANPEGYGLSYYFDVGDFQIVVYSKSPIECPGVILVRGTVIKVQGSSKRPGTKADESFVEYHVTADSWECREHG